MMARAAVAVLIFAIAAYAWLRGGAPQAEPGHPPAVAGRAAERIAAPRAPELVAFDGRWDRTPPGRLPGGTGARSFHVGDAVTFLFRGEVIRIYGVTGPGGGSGAVILPGHPPAAIDCTGDRRLAHRLLYTSPALGPGVHTLSIVVRHPHDPGRARGYVNIEGSDVLGDPG